MVKPVNGQNPVVAQAAKIRLGMPGDEEAEREAEEGDWAWEEADVPAGEPLSMDEAMAGASRPRRAKRNAPRPRTPAPDRGKAWEPPWPVDAEGNAVGVSVARDGDQPGEDIPPGFENIPRGTAELAYKVMAPR